MRTHISSSSFGTRSAAALVVLSALVSGCSLDRASAPSEIGPSGHALSLTLVATPDIVVRDGVSTSRILVRARNDQGQPSGPMQIFLATTAGTLSEPVVTTNANGEASVVFTAPAVNEPVTQAVISATAGGNDGNFDNGTTRNVVVGLAGPDVPAAAFTFTPTAPARFEQVTFDGTGTTVGGASCSGCTFNWQFGSEATGSGSIAQYRFQNEGVHQVTLTVTRNGVSGSTTRTVTVGMPVAPTASFTYSPTNPKENDTVFFNAAGSRGANGATIVEYAWEFGNGQRITSTSSTVSTTYALARTYNVQLTVTDTNGQTAVKEQSVTISEP